MRKMVYVVHEIPAEDAGRMVLLPADARDGYSARLIVTGDSLSAVAGIMRAERERGERSDRASQIETARALLDDPDFASAGKLMDVKITLGPGVPAGGPFAPDPAVVVEDDGETD